MKPVGFLHTGMELVIVGDFFYYIFFSSVFTVTPVSASSVFLHGWHGCDRGRRAVLQEAESPKPGFNSLWLNFRKVISSFFHSSHQPWKGKSSHVWLGGCYAIFFFFFKVL